MICKIFIILSINLLMPIILDEEQSRAIDLMKSGANVFLTGGGGTGKSKVLETYIEWFKSKYPYDYKQLLGITSTTGSSALLIGGTTIHSFSGIGVSKESHDIIISRILKKKYTTKRLKYLKTLIIDEISMLTPLTFQLLYRLCQLIRKNDRPFGGIQIILSGDFCQLAPILEQHIENHDREYCFETPEWNYSNIDIIHFKKIHRKTDTQFIEAVQKIRMGISDQDTTSLLMSRFKENLNNNYGVLPVQLFPTRTKANEINQTYFTKVSNEKDNSNQIKNYNISLSYESRDPERPIINKADIEHRIVSQLPIDDKIQLCVGCQVILVINLSIEEGLVNGSKGIVHGFNENNEPIVIFSNGIQKNIAIYQWEIDEGSYIIRALGIPLILGYGCTIHRSQGMSIDLAVVDIGRDVFKGNGGYGQIYVALSRVRTLIGLSIINFDPSRIKCHPKVVAFYKNLDNPDKQKVVSLINTVVIPKMLRETAKPKKDELLKKQYSITSFFK